MWAALAWAKGLRVVVLGCSVVLGEAEAPHAARSSVELEVVVEDTLETEWVGGSRGRPTSLPADVAGDSGYDLRGALWQVLHSPASS